MEINLVLEGLKFMVLGMVTVFLFLILMVIVLHFQAKILNKFFPQKANPAPSRKTSSVTQSSPQGDNKAAVVAAITAAIQTYKNSK